MKGLYFEDYQRLMSNSHQLLDHIFKAKIMAMKHCKGLVAAKPKKFGRSGTHLFKQAIGTSIISDQKCNDVGPSFQIP